MIGLHEKDILLLEKIVESLGVGKIFKHKGMIHYRVSSIKDLVVIIDHFDKYPLITQKQADYLLFKEAFKLVNRKEHLTIEGIHKIVSIKALMNNGLSDNLKYFFSDITPVPRSLILSKKIPNPNWLAGFVTGDGSFLIHLQKSSSHTCGFQIKLKLQITQHSRDTQLMKSLVEYLDCGQYKERSSKFAGDFIVTKFSDINEKIIPFFNKYPIKGVKALDFSDFCKVAIIINNKAHLTKEGMEQIIKIKEGMNTGR